MANIFNQVEQQKLGSNVFPLPHSRKLSCKFGELVPILIMPTIPGDKFSLDVSQMLRFQPILAPVMHRISVYTHFFYVPTRTIWKEWELFMTSPDPDDVLQPDPIEIPKLYLSEDGAENNEIEVTEGSLADHLGLPLSSQFVADSQIEVSMLPFWVYQRCYKDYYRDQNLEVPDASLFDPDYYYNSSLWPFEYNGLAGDTAGGAAMVDFSSTLRLRAWQHDYFTSCLPFAQKGEPVTIPIGSTAPILYDTAGGPDIAYDSTTETLAIGPNSIDIQAGGLGEVYQDIGGAQQGPISIDNSAHLSADLENAVAASVADLRTAFQLEKYLERNARSGSRYFEWIQAHFGVKVSDGLLQRPKYIGGGSNPVVISEVLQTSATSSEPTPQGNMSGHAISAGKSAGFTYACKEHGYIIGIMSVMPKTAYQQGIPREFTKFDQFDFFTAEFQNIGEQPVYNKELYATGEAEDDEVFGYIMRYAEYKYMPSTVHGVFKSSYDYWHAGRIFSARPALNYDFIKMQASEISRIFAVEEASAEQLLVYVNFNIKARRKMQFFGSPGIIKM